MSDSEKTNERSMGLVAATSVGVGAIVGGGILALAGIAFATTGPSAILAFALNGLLAFLTAFSFAELAAKFPQSGGTYTYAKKVLSVETAFVIGWIVWFASIAAGVLYSVGFGYFTSVAVAECWRLISGSSPAWLASRSAVVVLGLGAIGFYVAQLTRKSGGGHGHWENLGKLAVFAVLIGGGLYALAGRSTASIAAGMTPFFSGGAFGLFQAMGFTFIALQGFDLIAAAAGEVRDPARTIPRAMYLSLAVALVIYMLLLFTIIAAGLEPGESIVAASRKNPEEIVVIAARRFLGTPGFWLVLIAAILSMLSALRANLFAASRIVFAMARDRTMPYVLTRTNRAGHADRGDSGDRPDYRHRRRGLVRRGRGRRGVQPDLSDQLRRRALDHDPGSDPAERAQGGLSQFSCQRKWDCPLWAAQGQAARAAVPLAPRDRRRKLPDAGRLSGGHDPQRRARRRRMAVPGRAFVLGIAGPAGPRGRCLGGGAGPRNLAPPRQKSLDPGPHRQSHQRRGDDRSGRRADAPRRRPGAAAFGRRAAERLARGRRRSSRPTRPSRARRHPAGIGPGRPLPRGPGHRGG